jgi:beta-mannosidase
VSDALLQCKKIYLVISGLDTLGEIKLNGVKIASADNAYRIWYFDITAGAGTSDYFRAGENEIEILLKSPKDYLKKDSSGNVLKDQFTIFSPGAGTFGNIAKIRKPQCHFGWDWGPALPPAGITGGISIEGIEKARLEQVLIIQEHQSKRVVITAEAKTETIADGAAMAKLRLRSPDGRIMECTAEINKSTVLLNVVEEQPTLWWSNGLGEQPLYRVTVTIHDTGGIELDRWDKHIGLRTIELDTSADQWGNTFRFKVNNVPVFIKGANWIPSDSFVTRTTQDELEFYIKSARDANMNMLRVWGGGYYESDMFYEICDRYGILVWQDFAFACNEYPLDDGNFLAGVRQEVQDNVRRLRHHPSLSLWCGNNELFISDQGGKKKHGYQALKEKFFYQTLEEWLRCDDAATAYWPGSPNSGSPIYKANSLDRGDTHLWQVWHGLLPIESFRKYPTRFCTEYGLESMPSMRTVRTFTENMNLDIRTPVIAAHQKCVGGNEKMLFYMLSKYRNPAEFEDFIYLSQIIQAEAMRTATEYWRRNIGRCNGALYWQYNDCWPVASWSGIDYGRQYKALQYRAKYFNAMRSVSVDMYNKYCKLYVLNDLPDKFSGKLCWRLEDFWGNAISHGEFEAEVMGVSAIKAGRLSYDDILCGQKKENTALTVELLNSDNNVVARFHDLLVADKKANLPVPSLTTALTVAEGIGTLRITAKSYARFVFIEIDEITTPLSDNFFDICGGQTAVVKFTVPNTVNTDDLVSRVSIKTISGIKYRSNAFQDTLTRLAARLRPINLLMWAALKFI